MVSKFFTLEFLNTRLRLFPFSGRDSRNKPAPISGNNSQKNILIKQTAADCHSLTTILPLLVAHCIPESDPYWICYIAVLNCLDYILAPALHIGQINYMEELIFEFITAYKMLNNSIHIKPKLHFAIHYGWLPVSSIWASYLLLYQRFPNWEARLPREARTCAWGGVGGKTEKN